MKPLAVDNWESHWENYSDSAEKNPAQKLRRDTIMKHIYPTDNQVLDIGSGQGDLLLQIHRKNQHTKLYGIELSQSGINIAQKKLPMAEFTQHDCMQPLPLTFPKFDKAICSEVLEHLEDPSTFLKNTLPLINPKGSLLVTVPAGPRSAFDIHIGHRKHYTRSKLKNLLLEAGYKTTSCYAIGFPFFNLYKLVVILRGKKLVSDVAANTENKSSKLASLVMAAFDFLFKFNLNFIPLGWQLIAVATPITNKMESK